MEYRRLGRPPKSGLAPGRNPATSTMLVYADDEFEFLRAIDAYKRDHRRPHPTWTEVLEVFKSLGYRKVEEAGPLPTYAPPPTEM